MVRSVIAFLPAVLAASESVLMQSQSSSDGVLALESANDHMMEALHAGSGRVQKMQQNTHAMEDQYRALLQNIVSSGSMNNPETGKPWLPSQNFFDVVKKQFQALKDELIGEKGANQQILDDAHAAVVACNTVRKETFEAGSPHGVLFLLKAMQDARTTHSSCRGTEDNDIADMESKCADFDNHQTKCEENQDWYAQYDDSDIYAPDTAQNTLAEVVGDAMKCKLAVDTTGATAAQCDTDQTSFKTAFCTYENHLSKTCKTHADCYTLQTTNLDASEKSVKALEIEQKTIWRMIGKVSCYVTKLQAAGPSTMPTQADITECSEAPIVDTELNIDYKTPQEEDNCMQNTALGGDYGSPSYRPGVGTWYNKEMVEKGLDDHAKLNADSTCAHR